MDPLVALWFFLVILQQDGGLGMTFGTEQECVETRQQAATDPRTLFITDCIRLPLTPIIRPQENRTNT